MRRVIIFILAAGLVIGFMTIFQKQVKNFFYSISSPFQKNIWQAGDSASDFFAGFLKAADLKRENEWLAAKIQELRQEKAVLQELGKENKLLRQVLSLGMEGEFDLKLARVVGKDILKDVLTINRGAEDGVSLGLPVVTSQKILVGRIGEVYQNFSRVILITDKDSQFDAKVVVSDIYGMARGKGNHSLALDLISKDKDIKAGDLVLTSSLGGVFPANLLVGMVKNAEKSDINPFQGIDLTPAFNVNDLDELFIIEQ